MREQGTSHGGMCVDACSDDRAVRLDVERKRGLDQHLDRIQQLSEWCCLSEQLYVFRRGIQRHDRQDD
jgi:hypothetical protein